MGLRLMQEASLIRVHLLLGDLPPPMFPADSFDCLEFIWISFLEDLFSFLFPSLASCLDAVLYSLRNRISRMILMSLVALAPILEALEAVSYTHLTLPTIYPV